MWLRPLMLFVLTAGLAVAVGDFSSDALAQDKKAKFKNKKKKVELPPPARVSDRRQRLRSSDAGDD